jgi:hypothetical protein
VVGVGEHAICRHDDVALDAKTGHAPCS